jgi:membrane protein
VALRRTPVALWRDDIDHWAAALTYYSVLAVFPTLLVAMSVTGLAHPAAAQELIYQVTALMPAGSRSDVRTTLRDVRDQPSAVWLVIAVGGASAWLSAYNYLSVFRRVLHGMHGVMDHRPPWRAVPRTMVTSLGLLALLVCSATVLILTGGAVRAIGRLLGTGDAGATAWNLLKWPLLLILVTGLVLMLFRTGPPGTRAPHRSAPGGTLAVLLWLVTSAAFALYASHVPTYSRLYGSLAGIIVFLVWLWVSNLTLLAGAQFNAEVAKCAAAAARPTPGHRLTARPGPTARHRRGAPVPTRRH